MKYLKSGILLLDFYQPTYIILKTIVNFSFLITKNKEVEHLIETGDSNPLKQICYPVFPAIQAIIIEELDKMLQDGIIEPFTNSWSSRIVIVKMPEVAIDSAWTSGN